MDTHSHATAIRAVPAQWLDCGFRLLVMRQYHADGAPPAFALIEQRLLRTPQRFGRHGLSFANTFLPEVMAWLSDHLGRPSLHDDSRRPSRNPRWPVLRWQSEDRLWPDGMRTTEWFAEVDFRDAAAWVAFAERWHDRLRGGIAGERSDGVDDPSSPSAVARLNQ
ncbi:hypothetical protein [Bradyrhizobium sp.]|uniref:hypothetical protein n=1 Tax=Bradyrhizobium sp. TaxID=376 RepID=UPI003C3AE40E